MSSILLTCYFHIESLPLHTVAIRNIVVPKGASYTIDTVYEYYKDIIGITDITIESLPVPDTFQVTRIGHVGRPEDSWPAYDATLLKERIPTYQSFLKGVIAGEEARIALGLSIPFMENLEEIECLPKPSWVETVEEIIETIEECTMGEKPPTIIGWMWAPLYPPTRKDRGLYLVIDPSWNTTWAPLLGTSEFPDLTLAQRISSSNWIVQRPSSDHLLKAMLEWWMEAHGGTSSPHQWVRSSEEELISIIDIFRNKGIYKQKEVPATPIERNNPVKLALLCMEESLLGNPTVYSPEALLVPTCVDTWNQWVIRSLRFQGVVMDLYTEYIRTEIDRWIRDGWGIRIDKLPYPNPTSVYETVWASLISVKKITEETLHIWLRLLNANDPLKQLYITKEEKYQILSDWIPIVVHSIKSSNTNSRAKTSKTFDYIRTWLLQYLPRDIFELIMIPKRLHPAINACGHRTVHGSNGYFFLGLELPSETTSTHSNEVD